MFGSAPQDGTPQLVTLDALSHMLPSSQAAAASLPSALFVHGTLVPQAKDVPPGLVQERAQIGPIQDWSVVHSRDGGATIAVQTQAAWYRLQQPMAAYAPLFAHVLLFARACVAMTGAVKRHVEMHMASGSASASSAQSAVPSARQAMEAGLQGLIVQFGYSGHLALHVHVCANSVLALRCL